MLNNLLYHSTILNKQKTMSLAINLQHTHLATTHSTNSELIDWMIKSFKSEVIQNKPHFSQPYLFTANSQTSGRGQHGRTWQSPLGNVYLSLYIPTAKFAENDISQLKQRLDGRLSLCVGYQLSQMAEITSLEKIGVKWVNDIGFYKDDIFQKLSGILIEPVSLENQLLGVVVGVGMNISSTPTLTAQTQEGLNYQAVSLQDLVKKELTASDFYPPISQAILQAVEQFNGFNEPSNVAEFLQNFQQIDILLGKNLQITLPTQDKIIGTAHGIDSNGCLQLLQEDGTIMPIWTGTIQVLQT